MQKLNGNYIKVTLYKAKICSEANLNSFILKMDCNKQSLESEKVQGREADLGAKVLKI